MIIKITKCSEDHYWYKNRVGLFYKVLNKGEMAYAVVDRNNTDKSQAAVMVGDFEIVRKPFCYHIAYHWSSKEGEGFESENLYTDFELNSSANLDTIKSHLKVNYRYSHIVIINFIELKDMG